MEYKIAIELKGIIMVVFCAFFFSTIYCQRKDHFFIRGSYIGNNAKSITLYYNDTNGVRVHGTCDLINNQFTFSGVIKEPTTASLKSDLASNLSADANWCPVFFIEPTVMKINVEEGHFKYLKISGSKTQNQYDSLEKSKAPVYNQKAYLDLQLDRLNDTLGFSFKKKDTIKINDIMRKRGFIFSEMKPYIDELSKLDLKFIARHPDSYLSAYLLNRQFKIYKLAKDSVRLLLNRLSPIVRNGYWGSSIRLWLNPDKILPVGAIFPNINGINVKGEKLSTNRLLKSDYTLIIFWASWCPPCRELAPTYNALYDKYHNSGLDIVAITDDSVNKYWLNAIRKDHTSAWKHVFPDIKYNTSDLFGIHSIPAEILLKKDTIIGRYMGAATGSDAGIEGLKNKLEQIYHN